MAESPKLPGVAPTAARMLGSGAMMENVLNWLKGAAPGGGAPADELQLALAALLVEVAYSSDRFAESERKVVARLLEQRFDLAEPRALSLLAAGEREAERSAELFHLTQVVNDRLSPQQRIDLVEMLWEVAYADGVLDQYEDSLLRRIGGLVYVSDQERGAARQRVVARRGLGRTIRSAARAPAAPIQQKKSLP
jgi:uncharacterized tellurite resistance protein B-like protein